MGQKQGGNPYACMSAVQNKSDLFLKSTYSHLLHFQWITVIYWPTNPTR